MQGCWHNIDGCIGRIKEQSNYAQTHTLVGLGFEPPSPSSLDSSLEACDGNQKQLFQDNACNVTQRAYSTAPAWPSSLLQRHSSFPRFQQKASHIIRTRMQHKIHHSVCCHRPQGRAIGHGVLCGAQLIGTEASLSFKKYSALARRPAAKAESNGLTHRAAPCGSVAAVVLKGHAPHDHV